MPATPDDLFACLDRLGIAHATVTHPPLFTVEESRALRGKIPGGHSKNLFLRDKKGAVFLVTALEDAAIELKSLHRTLGANGRFSFGSTELMRETLGIEPGSVTPFAAHQRHRRTGHRGAGRRHDGTRPDQFSSAAQHHDDHHCARRSGKVPRRDRPSAADRGGLTARRRVRGDDCNRFHGHHLIGHNPIIRASRGRGSQGQQDGRKICFRTRANMNVTVTTGAAPAADGLIKETTTQTFVKDVIEESKRQPVLIDFWAPWCGPCKQLTPILEKAVKAAKGKVKLVKMNIDEHPAVPGQMGIQSIPAVIAFVNGQPADGFMGALPESQVIAVPGAAHQGQDRRRGKRRAGGGRCRAGAGRRDHRRQSLRLVAGARRDQRRGAGRAGAQLSADRRDRAGQADACDGAGGQDATTRRSPRRAPHSSSSSRRSRSVRSTN